MRRWHKTLRPAHPALIPLQAAGVVAVLFLPLLFIRYGEAAPQARMTAAQRTGYNRSLSPNLFRMVNQLDPTIKCTSDENALDQSVYKVHLRQLERPMPRPSEIYLLREPAAVSKLNVCELLPVADLRVGDQNRETSAAPAGFAVMYAENGEEIARWQSSFYADGKALLTQVRVSGNGIMKRTMVTRSCGDRSIDLLAVEKVLQSHAAPGIYSIFYPSKAQGK